MTDARVNGHEGAPVGGKDVGTGWTAFFWVAAAFNFLIGAVGMFAPDSTIDGRIVALLVFNFGIIYMLVAREPQRFAPALWAGVIGKLGVVGLLGPSALEAAAANPGGMAIVVVLGFDALFALGFLIFLMTKGDSARAE